MDKKQAHFEALGYEPLRMKPVHFASGFFMAVTDSVYVNELLNQVAVTKTNKGLLDGYAPDAVFERLRSEGLIMEGVTQTEVELLRIQVNGVVNNDAAMYPAFKPYRQKGNDYTFFTPRLLTRASRTDGYAGHFVAAALAATAEGTEVLRFARDVAEESPGTLERFVQPLLKGGVPDNACLAPKYEREYGRLAPTRVTYVSKLMHRQTDAIARLCTNLADCSHYHRIRYLVLGLLAWLMAYLLRTAAVNADGPPLLLFDFVGARDGPIRSQSQTCYARLREIVRRTYLEFADAGRFSDNPITQGIFERKSPPMRNDFRFLEEHFGDLALRMGYAQPRASGVPQKHFEFQPDTLRTLVLSILDSDPASPITFDELCGGLRDKWNIVAGGAADYETLRQHGYFGFDETDLNQNAIMFTDRLKGLNLAAEPSDGLVLCSKRIGEEM